nr:hypothetical protein CFP56_10964 [Quercus suber]POF00888.1 hypothetical protein CFP56_20836 [Quercus suber]
MGEGALNLGMGLFVDTWKHAEPNLNNGCKTSGFATMFSDGVQKGKEIVKWSLRVASSILALTRDFWQGQMKESCRNRATEPSRTQQRYSDCRVMRV